MLTSSITSEIYRTHTLSLSLSVTLIAGNSQPVGNSLLDAGNAAAGNDSAVAGSDATAARRSSGAAASANSPAGLCRSRCPLRTTTDARGKLRRAAGSGSGSRSGFHDARCTLVRLGRRHCASAAVAVADAA